MQNSNKLRNRHHHNSDHDQQCDHDHHLNDDERKSRNVSHQQAASSFLITCCTNLSYFIIATSLLLGLFITNEQFSFIKEETNRKLDFTRIYNEKTELGNNYHLLFVHGAFGRKEEWMHYYFPYFQQVGNPNIKSIGAFSMTGHGQSSHSEYIKWLRLYDFVKDLKSIIDNNYKSEKVILVCHSLGGLVCQKYLETLSLENDPNISIRSLILLGSIPPIHRFDNILPSVLFDPTVALDMLLTQRLDPLVTKSIKHIKHFMYHEKTSESQIEQLSKQVSFNQEGLIFYFDSLTSSLNPSPIMEYFDKRRISVMVIGIEKDAFFSVGQFEKTVEFWNLILNFKPHHQVHSVLIPNSIQVGHQMMLDNDWEFVANKINEFIKELHE